ncbi:MAG: DedA family protein [Alphaproteobacteria bacterium]|nr:DedA family protein [Alphaproteobacteria bacterium]
MLAELVHIIHRSIGDYGYLAVFLAIFLEDFGLPVPGETLLVTAAAVAAQHALNIWLLAGIAWLGAVFGDNVGFLIGHTGGHVLLIRYGNRVGLTADNLAKVERFVERYGAPIIVVARFVVIARQLNGVAAGSLGMHWLRFLAFNCIGAALWVGFWSTIAYWLGKGVFSFLATMQSVEPLAIGAGCAVLALAATYVCWRIRRRRQMGRM